MVIFYKEVMKVVQHIEELVLMLSCLQSSGK